MEGNRPLLTGDVRSLRLPHTAEGFSNTEARASSTRFGLPSRRKHIMLITFNSAAAGNIIMFQSDAENILTLLGKDISQAKGILTVEQMPAAIEKLQRTIRLGNNRANKVSPKNDTEGDAEGKEAQVVQPVSFAQHAQPFLEFMQTSLKGNKPITWGV